jgi:3-methyladenine DNA glycosylase AlkD
MRSGNIWLVRATLLFQMKYRAQADEQLLYALIRQCMHEKEFFIRKAIGWALSEHSKTFPASVKRFVKENFSTLSPLSRKEALRQFR